MKLARTVMIALACAARLALAQQPAGHETPAASGSRHVPPPAPEHPLPDMSNQRMIELMGMDDTAAFGMLLFDRLEWRKAGGRDALDWDAHAWFGNDYHKAWLKSEGEWAGSEYHARTELLWDRILSRWWNVQAGVRHDINEGPSRTWAALGMHGLAPHWFDVEATLYFGEQGRTALRASAQSDLLLTQRLILQPRFELNAYGKDDVANGIGTGVSSGELSLRLRYEFRRELAPYVGIAWTRSYGQTADLVRAAGRDASDLQLVAGLRVWF